MAHFGGPLVLDVDGDHATALNCLLIMRREDRRSHLGRVGAVRWDLERSGSMWRVGRRTNRQLDETGAGCRLFGLALSAMFPEGPT